MSTLLKLGGLGVALVVSWYLTTSAPGESPRVTMSPDSIPPSSYDAGREATAVDRASPAAPTVVSTAPVPPQTAHEFPRKSADHHHHHGNVPSDLYPRQQGPFTQLAQRFASESRGPNAEAEEARLRAPFADIPTIPIELVPSFECRRTVCRTEVRWDLHLGPSYNAALMRAVQKPAGPFGLGEAGPLDDEGFRPVVVYIDLAQPGATSPDSASSE